MRHLNANVVSFLEDHRREPWFPDIWCLQEVKTIRGIERCRLELLGTVIFQERLDEHAKQCSGGLCCVVSKCFTILHVAHYASTQHGMLVECLILEVQEVNASTPSTRLGNIYCSPGGTLNMGLLDELTQPPYSVDIFAGDFNARHTSWSMGQRSSATDAYARGTAIVRWCSRHLFSRSNQEIPILATTNSGTSLDLVLNIFLFRI